MGTLVAGGERRDATRSSVVADGGGELGGFAEAEGGAVPPASRDVVDGVRSSSGWTCGCALELG